MDSLFTRLQSYFRESFGGRYFETIIKELAIDDPAIIDTIFSRYRFFKPEKHTVQTEYPFRISGRDRFADIAIIDRETERPVGLIEVKYDDHLKNENQLQIQDYVRIAAKYNLPFVYLTQYYPPMKHCNIVQDRGHRQMLFSDLGVALHDKNSISKNSARSLLINFLKDKGYMFTKIDSTGLWKLLVRLFNPQRGQGKIRSAFDITENIPATFANIMGNMNVINTEIARRLCPAVSPPALDFAIIPCANFKLDKLDKLIAAERKKKSKKLYVEIDNEHKFGGYLWIYGESCICPTKAKKPWVYFDYGFGFEIDTGERSFISKIYAQVSSPSLGEDGEGWIFKKLDIPNFSMISDKPFLIKNLTDLIMNAFTEATKMDEISYAKKPIEKIIKTLKEAR